MKEQLSARGKKLWASFLAFTPGQKAVTIATVLGLTIGGYLFMTWAAKPTYAPLFTNLAPVDASAITDKLNANKTPYQLAAGGTEILVAQKDVYALRLTMSAANLPSSGTSGYNLLDKEGITTSQFKQNVDYQRALEGELDKTIKSISGITDAQVHLAIPQDSVFNDGTNKTTAAVLLTIAPGTSPGGGQVQSIVNLVSASVPQLSPANVSVSDSQGRVLSNGTDGGAAAMTDAQTAQTQAMNTTLAASLQAMLDKITGTGHSVVTVNSTLNFDKTTSQSVNYSKAPGNLNIANVQTSESYAGTGGSASSGVLGVTSASPSLSGGTGATGGGNGAYVKTSGAFQPAVDSISQSTVTAPGSVKYLSVAVAVDQTGLGAATKAQIQNLVNSAAGINPARGDKVAVEAMAFDTSAAAAASSAAAKAASAAASAQGSKALMGMVKTGLIVLAVIAVIIFALISSRRRRKPEEPDDLDVFLAQLNENPQLLPPAPVDIIGPKSDAAQSAAQHQRQLSEMADDNPDEVARLLRSWLNAKD